MNPTKKKSDAAGRTAFTPVESITIGDVDTLKSLSDPLRIRILELLADPRPAKQLAATLGLPKTRLYYHLGILEKHGLIRVVSERIVSGITERTYQVAAKQFRIEKSLLGPTSESGADIVGSLLQAVRSDVRNSSDAGLISMHEDEARSRGLFVSRVTTCIRPDDAQRFYKKLAALFEEFHAASDDDAGRAYSLTVLFHPSTLGDASPAPSRRNAARQSKRI